MTSTSGGVPTWMKAKGIMSKGTESKTRNVSTVPNSSLSIISMVKVASNSDDANTDLRLMRSIVGSDDACPPSTDSVGAGMERS